MIEELGQLALEKNLLLHVDGCMGGFLLPYLRRAGAPVPRFEFDVPGVTSMSMDFHKYAFAAKGASVILHRSKELRRYQIYACSNWTGYTVINPTVQSTKSAGPVAAAWDGRARDVTSRVARRDDVYADGYVEGSAQGIAAEPWSFTFECMMKCPKYGSACGCTRTRSPSCASSRAAWRSV